MKLDRGTSVPSKAIIDIGSAFAPGQVYVALSRLRSLDGLVLTSKINYESIRPDVVVLNYSENKTKQQNLLDLAKQESAKYIRNFILSSFDINSLVRTVNGHCNSYIKDEKRSEKQKHHDWAISLKSKLEELMPTCEKFQTQIIRITEKEYTINYLQERVVAARDYFKPQLVSIIEYIIDHKDLVKKEKKIKQYLKELTQLEVAFQEQLKQMYKAAALIEAQINGDSLTKKYHEQVNKELIIESKEIEVVVKSEKIKKIKPEKGSSKKDSFILYKEGISIKEIAALRSLTEQTIENHLASYVKTGEIKANELISEEKLNTIISLFKKLNTLAATPIKEKLPSNYSYSDIRFARAFYESMTE